MSDNGERDKAIDPEMRQNEVDSESEDNSDDIYSDEDECHEFDAMKAVSSVANFVCTTEVDPRSVSSDSFIGFMKSLNPQFQLDYTSVEAKCVASFLKEKVKIMEKLGSFDGEISVSVDVMGWRTSFVRVSLHFIDESWSLKNWVIKFCSLEKPSYVSPWEAIVESLEDWGIKNKISTVTMSSFYDADTFDYIKEHGLEKKKLSLNGDLFRVYCCGDCISLMVQYAFKEVKDIIDKVHSLYNPKKEPLWYLTSFNLKNTIELWSMGEFSSENVTSNYDVPAAEEWNRIEQVCNIVESIYKVADGIFQKEHVTANHFLYLLNEIRAILAPISIKPESFEGTIAKGMLEQLDKYFKDMFLVLAIAAVLDPRFKMKYVEFTCSQVWASSSGSTDDGISKTKTFSDTIRNLFDDYVSRYPKTASSSSSSLMHRYQQFIQSQKCDMKSELEWYLEQPVLPWSDDFLVLDWWKTSSIQYPILSRMARDILAIPMSLATSYDAFYTEPRPVEEYLSRLNSKMVNALVCTRSWSKKDSTSTST
ncbi:zinc finger BED domain-containing protein RICESLEEPER 2-like [Humulus lupulus]|uniref:zinc finger BED domain-containing protein RICESLEEPER 2-like n=1 Tax=Humulus lupulus TaxID=3486 RepID=UPI002B407771|nr:zinc finger BED domain-containing protein RICESLEEPER 2-like [Humulus lupulus]